MNIELLKNRLVDYAKTLSDSHDREGQITGQMIGSCCDILRGRYPLDSETKRHLAAFAAHRGIETH